jgi:hypothetical protein
MGLISMPVLTPLARKRRGRGGRRCWWKPQRNYCADTSQWQLGLKCSPSKWCRIVAFGPLQDSPCRWGWSKKKSIDLVRSINWEWCICVSSPIFKHNLMFPSLQVKKSDNDKEGTILTVFIQSLFQLTVHFLSCQSSTSILKVIRIWGSYCRSSIWVH